jgi:DNA-binding response OmpR family regulator
MHSSNADESSDDLSILSGMKILVVEDSWQIGSALKRLLEAWGAEVCGPVATVADAQSLATKQAPNAALVDFSLRGGEYATTLVGRLRDQGVYVILMTGYPLVPAFLRHAAILQKPFSEEQLRGSLCQVARLKR